MESVVQLAVELLGLDCESHGNFLSPAECSTPRRSVANDAESCGFGHYFEALCSNALDQGCLTPRSSCDAETETLINVLDAASSWLLTAGDTLYLANGVENLVNFPMEGGSRSYEKQSKWSPFENEWRSQNVRFSSIQGIGDEKVTRTPRKDCDMLPSDVPLAMYSSESVVSQSEQVPNYKQEVWTDDDLEPKNAKQLGEGLSTPKALTIRVTSAERAGKKTVSAVYSVMPFVNVCGENGIDDMPDAVRSHSHLTRRQAKESMRLIPAACDSVVPALGSNSSSALQFASVTSSQGEINDRSVGPKQPRVINRYLDKGANSDMESIMCQPRERMENDLKCDLESINREMDSINEMESIHGMDGIHDMDSIRPDLDSMHRGMDSMHCAIDSVHEMDAIHQELDSMHHPIGPLQRCHIEPRARDTFPNYGTHNAAGSYDSILTHETKPKKQKKKKRKLNTAQLKQRTDSSQQAAAHQAAVAAYGETTKSSQKSNEKQRLETAAYDENGNRVAGVWYDNTRRLWRVMYLEGDKRKTKGFSPRDYGYLKARDMAVALKFEKMKKNEGFGDFRPKKA